MILLSAAASCLSGQSGPLAFEVDSVKTVQDSRTWALRRVDPARYQSVSNVMQLITWAWKLKNYQVLGAPAWSSQERFEILATTAQPASVDDERLMLQRLLADRFGLKVHRESKEVPVYLLVVAANGPKLKAAGTGGDPRRRGININAGVLEAQQGGMDDFADVLTTNLDRPVLNRTNLTGSYDFTLTWDSPAEPDVAHAWTPIGAALFPLVRNLGLRLDVAKAPIEMLVIDALNLPAAN